jgi:hypothetical protein
MAWVVSIGTVSIARSTSVYRRGTSWPAIVASVIRARTTLGAGQRSTGNPGNVALARTKIGDARGGAIIFSDLIGRLDLIRVACDKCGRDGCYV